MATDKRFVVKNGLQTENINFVFNDAVVGSSNITATMLSSNVLSFSGTSGQLFSIADTMTGVIFAVNDISGVPSIEVYDDGRVRLAETFGNVTIGNTTVNNARASTSTVTGILQVAGGTGITGNINVGGTRNLFTGFVGIGTSAVAGINSNVFSVYGTQMLYGNLDLANPTGGTSGIYFADGTYQTTAATAGTASSGIAGTVQFSGGSGTFAGDATNFFWDDANNRLGIGSSAPSNTLTVWGATPAWFNTTNGSNIFEVLVGNATTTAATLGYASTPTSPYSYIKNAGGTVGLVVVNSGSVGVRGITNPLNALDVGGAVAVGSGYAGVRTAPTNGLIVQTSVGIGTFTVASTLDVWGTGSFTSALSAGGTASVNTLVSNVYGLFGQNVTVNSANASTSTSTGALILAGGAGIAGNINVGGSVNYFAGRVGIGSTAPTKPLDVLVNDTMRVYSANVGHIGINIQNTGTNGRNFRIASYADATASNTSFRIRDDSVGFDRLVIDTSGYVGIGTVTPGSFLDVNGNASFRSAVSVAGATAVASLNVNAGTYTDTLNVNTTANVNALTSNTGITVSAGGLTVTGLSTFTGNVGITGNLNVTGTINTQNANVLVVNDPIIYLGEGNTSNLWDLGIVANYNDGVYEHTGFVRNRNDGVWTLFDTMTSEPNVSTGNINWADSTLTFAAMKLGNLTVAGNTRSTSSTTGALILNNFSGLGVGGNIYVGGQQSGISGNLWIAGSNASTSSTTGALVVAGGVGMAGNLNVGGLLNTTGNAFVGSNLQVKGGQITTTQTGTASIFDSNVATLNIGRSASVINMSAEGPNSVYVHGTLFLGSKTITTYNGGSGSIFNTNVAFLDIGGASLTTNIGSASGIIYTPGDISVNGGDIFSTAATGTIFNSNVTTLSMGQAASTINLGANSGTMTIGNPTVRGTQTTQNLYNTVATTMNFAGAATTISIGAATGTTTFNSNNTSTSTTTGALKVAGGIGLGGNINAGGTNHSLQGNVGIGTLSPVTQLHITTDNGSLSNRGLTIDQHNTGAQAALANFRKSRGTLASPTTVANSDYTGAFTFQNYDGSAYRTNAGFGARVNGTVASNSVPTDLYFWAGSTDDADPYTNNTVKMLITNSGRVGIGTVSPGSTLDVNGVASVRSAMSVAGTATVNSLVSNGSITGTNYLVTTASSTDASGVAIQRVAIKINVAAGELYQIAEYNDTEGTAAFEIQVSSESSGNSGTSTYRFQGGFSVLPGSYYRLLPFNDGRGHGNGPDNGYSSTSWEVYIYGTTVTGSAYTYGIAVYVPVGAATKNLVVTVTELKRGMTYIDRSGNAVVTSPTITGTIYSQRNLMVESRVGIATTSPGSPLDVNGNASFRSAISVAGAASVASLASNGAISGTTLNGTAGTFTSLQVSGTTTTNALVSNVYGLFGQNVTINSANASTSTTTGALIVGGGIGAAGNVVAGTFQPTSSTVPTNGMFLPAASTLGFATSSTEDMRLTSNGNLLLGITTAPAGGTSTIVIQGSGTNGSGIEFSNVNVAGANVGIGGSNSLVFSTYTGAVGSETYTERMRLLSNGNFGIGTASPETALHLNNPSAGGDTPRIRFTNTNTGTGATDGAFVGISNNNQLDIYNFEASSVRIATSNNERMRVDANGNVGINNTSPLYRVHVNNVATVGTSASVLANAQPILYLDNGAGIGGSIVIKAHSPGNGNQAGAMKFASSPDGVNYSWAGMAGIADTNAAASALAFYTAASNGQATAAGASTERMRIDINGNFLVGLTSGTDSTPSGGQFAGPMLIGGYLSTNQTNRAVLQYFSNEVSLRAYGATSGTGYITLRTGGGGNAADTERMRINSGGNVLIGTTTTPAGGTATVVIQGVGTNGSGIQFSNVNVAGANVGIGGSNSLVFSTYTGAVGSETYTERMRIDSVGNVGIGTNTITTGYRLQVRGGFAATTKSFVIDHPTKPDMKLRYGSLEGPENGVYVRGRTKSNVITLPDYWVGLVDEDSITVSLTAIGRKQELYVKEIKDNEIRIGGTRDVDCYYTVFAERKDVPKLLVEF